jgi:hypothetical protein
MLNKSFKTRNIFLVLFSLGSLIIAFSFPRISQEPSYHRFADHRLMLAVPNFMNVITNVPFLVMGVIGLFGLLRRGNSKPSLSAIALFIGVAGIGFGSAWYHYHPTNSTLVWDRIPITITFMSYLSIIVEQYVNKRLGAKMFIPMLVIGVFSVWYWYFTGQNGIGDLRLYAWVQFYPMLCIPLIIFLYPVPSNIRLGICSVILVYALAKITEENDYAILNSSGLISGHSLKHLFASISVLLILLTLREANSVSSDR